MRGLIRAVVASAVSLLVTVAVVQPTAAFAGDGITVTASSTAAGSAQALVTSSSRTSARWRSGGRPLGATLTMRFARAVPLDRMRLRGAGGALRIRDAQLRFSDGSSLLTRTTSNGSRSLVFRTRTVRWVRLTVFGVPNGVQQVGLSGWWFHRGIARYATRTTGDAVASARLFASSGSVTRTGWTAATSKGKQWVQASWPHPLELSAMRIAAAGVAGQTVHNGFLQFSDGSRLIVGTLESNGGAPTTIAFAPRVTSAVRFVAQQVDGGGRASTGRLSAWTVGTLPPQPHVDTRIIGASAPAARSCSSSTGAASAQLILLCPSNGARVGGHADLVISGPASTVLTVVAHRPNSAKPTFTVMTSVTSSRGIARLSVPTRRLTHGPTAVRITAAGLGTPLYVQLENTSGIAERVKASTYTRGMDLKYNEDFDSPLSVTRTGAAARYASGKPNSYGIDDFGDAIFAQPTRSNQNLGAGAGYLRFRSRGLRADEIDPAGYGRRLIGGLVSSGHSGASGFSAQYGYFEARMLGAAGKGAWPAFWLLSTGSLARSGASTGEIDAVELYGQNAAGACQTTHSWVAGRNASGKAFCKSLPADGDSALAWHTYGARVSATGTVFTIDGRVTARTKAVVGSGEPFFFLLNLALGGGWPVDLSGTRSVVTLYVDDVRVWV